MSDYYDKNDRESRRKRHAKSERVGFYTACSICLVAVCMAVYSTYNTLSVPDTEATQSTTVYESKVQVNENVTGITQTMAVPRLDTEISTIAATLPTEEAATARSTKESLQTGSESKTALETMLSVDVTLVCPLSANNIVREYSEKSVYFKTLNVWKPHTGTDFAGELGDDVYAMTGGAVTSVSEDAMLGKVVEISIDNIICRYCGLGSVNVAEGDSVDANAKIGTMGAVPCEADDENHIHIEVKVDDEYADPLSFFNNNE